MLLRMAVAVGDVLVVAAEDMIAAAVEVHLAAHLADVGLARSLVDHNRRQPSSRLAVRHRIRPFAHRLILPC